MATKFQELVNEAISHAEVAEDTADGHVAAALSFLYRAKGALIDRHGEEASDGESLEEREVEAPGE